MRYKFTPDSMRTARFVSFLFLAVFALASCKETPTDPIDTNLAAPTLTSPANGAQSAGNPITLKWNQVSGAIWYRVQLSKKEDFSTIEYDTTWSVTARELPYL